MKNLIQTLIVCATLALGWQARGQTPLIAFAGTGSQVETNLEFYVVSAAGVGVPMVTFYDVTSDNATTGILTFKTPSNATIVSTASTGTNITCVGTGYASNDVVVVWHKSADTYERRTVWSASATNINLTTALTTTAAVGDMVFEMTANGDILIGDNNKQVSAASGIFVGSRGAPLLLELAGTGTNTVDINVISGIYLKQ